MLLQQPAHALDTMESIGAEKCARAAKAYEIEFLAPDTATLEAKAKVVVKGATDNRPASLILDGKDCTNGRCGFEAKKGQTYRLSAKTGFRASTNSASSLLGRDRNRSERAVEQGIAGLIRS